MTEVLIYSEVAETALELATAALRISDGVSVAIVGSGDLLPTAKKLSVNGVSAVYLASDESLIDLVAEPIVDALESVHNQAKSDLILIGGTKRGREAAPRLATRLGVGCITDALKLQVQDGRVIAERLVWGGNAIATISAKLPCVVTIPLRAQERATGSSSPSIIGVGAHPRTQVKVRVVGRKEKPKGQANIKDADVVLSAGRGFKKKEDLAILEELAITLNGVVGASRPLTSDLGWMPEDRQVGLSGISVKPKLYIAVGISGQIQHLTGMRDSKIVAAINSDKNAPIFQECDYGIVGDLYAVIPELTKAFRAQLGK